MDKTDKFWLENHWLAKERLEKDNTRLRGLLFQAFSVIEMYAPNHPILDGDIFEELGRNAMSQNEKPS